MVRVRVGSWVNLFLLRVKKIGFGSGIFRVGSGRVGSGQKILTHFAMSTPYSMAPSALANGLWSLICSFSVIFIYSGKGVLINGFLSSYH